MNKPEILNFIKKHHIMHLSTLNSDGFPECRAVVNLLNKNIAPHLTDILGSGDKIYMMTNTHTSKISQIALNSKSSIYFVDNETFQGLLLIGDIIEVKNDEIKKSLWHDSWNMYYKGGLEGGDFSLLEFTPKTYKFYENLSVKQGDLEW